MTSQTLWGQFKAGDTPVAQSPNILNAPLGFRSSGQVEPRQPVESTRRPVKRGIVFATMVSTARPVVCLLVWLLACQVGGAYVSKGMHGTLKNLLQHYVSTVSVCVLSAHHILLFSSTCSWRIVVKRWSQCQPILTFTPSGNLEYSINLASFGSTWREPTGRERILHTERLLYLINPNTGG